LIAFRFVDLFAERLFVAGRSRFAGLYIGDLLAQAARPFVARRLRIILLVSHVSLS